MQGRFQVFAHLLRAYHQNGNLLSSRDFWDGVAVDYDAYYEARYSLLENHEVQRILQNVFTPVQGPVLDIGCGTGLGGDLLAPVHDTLYGIDISPRMIDQLSTREHAYQEVRVADACNLPYLDGFFAGAFAIFSTWSYLLDAQQAVHELARIMKPGAPIVIMALNATAFWRANHSSKRGILPYATRNYHGGKKVNALFYSRDDLNHYFSPLFDISIEALSWVGNTRLEAVMPWLLDRFLCQRLPRFGYNHVVIGRRLNA